MKKETKKDMAEKNIRGVDVALQFKSETEYIKLGGQRGATLNRDKETLDATTKDSSGWRENLPGLKEWSVECDGLIVVDDNAYTILEDAFNEDTPLSVQVAMPSGQIYEGEVILTSFPIELPYDDLVTYSATLTGSGALQKK